MIFNKQFWNNRNLTNESKLLKQQIQDIELKLISAKKNERNSLLDELDELEERRSDIKKRISKLKSSSNKKEKPFQDILEPEKVRPLPKQPPIKQAPSKQMQSKTISKQPPKQVKQSQIVKNAPKKMW